jgi:predicted nicotinamide N-methyase
MPVPPFVTMAWQGLQLQSNEIKMIPGIQYRGSSLADAAPGSGLHKHY